MYLASKYGLAFHLALTAAVAMSVVPLLPCAASTIAVLCLVAVSWEWMLAEPSVRTGETRAEARVRTLSAVAKDPLLWLSVLILAIALIRWINSGMVFEYSVQNQRWTLSGPDWPDAPSGVDSSVSGGLFAVLCALSTVTLGVRHALGAKARMAFGVSLAFCAGVAGWCLVSLAASGDAAILAEAKADLLASRVYGLPFGICLVAGCACISNADEYGWKAALFMAGFGLSGCAAALSFFSPPFYLYVFAAVAAVATLFSMARCAIAVSIASATRVFIAASLALAGFFVSILAVPEVASAKAAQAAQSRPAPPPPAGADAPQDGEDLQTQSVFDALKERREALAEVSSGLWKVGRGRWTGAGTGAFGLRVKEYIAGMTSKADRRRLWKALPYDLENVRPADFYRGFAMEHGIIGLLLVAVWLLVIAAGWVMRMAASVKAYRKSEDGPSAVFSFPAVCWFFPLFLFLAAFAGFYCMESECVNLLPASAALALSAASFPKVKTEAAKEAARDDIAPPPPPEPQEGAAGDGQGTVSKDLQGKDVING